MGEPIDFWFFDALEILPDGRFIAARAIGSEARFTRLIPVPDPMTGLAEVTLIPIMIDSLIVGGFNGLETFVGPPEGSVQALIDDILALNLDGRTERRLVRTLEDFEKKLERGKLEKARDRICQFIDQLESAVSGSKMMPADASSLLKDASVLLGDVAFPEE